MAPLDFCRLASEVARLCLSWVDFIATLDAWLQFWGFAPVAPYELDDLYGIYRVNLPEFSV